MGTGTEVLTGIPAGTRRGEQSDGRGGRREDRWYKDQGAVLASEKPTTQINWGGCHPCSTMRRVQGLINDAKGTRLGRGSGLGGRPGRGGPRGGAEPDDVPSRCRGRAKGWWASGGGPADVAHSMRPVGPQWHISRWGVVAQNLRLASNPRAHSPSKTTNSQPPKTITPPAPTPSTI